MGVVQTLIGQSAVLLWVSCYGVIETLEKHEPQEGLISESLGVVQ